MHGCVLGRQAERVIVFRRVVAAELAQQLLHGASALPDSFPERRTEHKLLVHRAAGSIRACSFGWKAVAERFHILGMIIDALAGT